MCPEIRITFSALKRQKFMSNFSIKTDKSDFNLVGYFCLKRGFSIDSIATIKKIKS